MWEGILSTYFLEQSKSLSLTALDPVSSNRLKQNDASKQDSSREIIPQVLSHQLQNIYVSSVGVIESGCVNQNDGSAVHLKAMLRKTLCTYKSFY